MNTSPLIRVAVVEDNPQFRDSLAALLRLSPGFQLAASCADAEEALRVLPAAAPDVVLMDINLPGRSGIACVRELRRLDPEAALLMLTIEQDSRKLMESLEAGADGYLVKTTPAIDSKEFSAQLKLELAPKRNPRVVVATDAQPKTLWHSLFEGAERRNARRLSIEHAERLNAGAMRDYRENCDRSLIRGTLPRMPLYPTRIDTSCASVKSLLTSVFAFTFCCS